MNNLQRFRIFATACPNGSYVVQRQYDSRMSRMCVDGNDLVASIYLPRWVASLLYTYWRIRHRINVADLEAKP